MTWHGTYLLQYIQWICHWAAAVQICNLWQVLLPECYRKNAKPVTIEMLVRAKISVFIYRYTKRSVNLWSERKWLICWAVQHFVHRTRVGIVRISSCTNSITSPRCRTCLRKCTKIIDNIRVARILCVTQGLIEYGTVLMCLQFRARFLLVKMYSFWWQRNGLARVYQDLRTRQRSHVAKRNLEFCSTAFRQSSVQFKNFELVVLYVWKHVSVKDDC